MSQIAPADVNAAEASSSHGPYRRKGDEATQDAEYDGKLSGAQRKRVAKEEQGPPLRPRTRRGGPLLEGRDWEGVQVWAHSTCARLVLCCVPRVNECR